MTVEQTSAAGRRNFKFARSADPDADFAALTNRYGLGQRSKKPGRIRWDPAELGPGKKGCFL